MRLSVISIVLAPLLLAIPSAARSAQVYISEPGTHTDVDTPSISASTARLIFARRLGLSQFHSLTQEDFDGDAVWALNAYGGVTEGLFGADTKRASKSLVFIEGYDNPVDLLPKDIRKHALRFFIDSAPSPQENDRLVQHLQAQHTAIVQQQDASRNTQSREISIESLAKGHAGSEIEVKTHLQELLAREDGLIVVFLDAMRTESTSKRSTSTWGSYKIIQKRQNDFFSGRPDITPESPADDFEVDLLQDGDEPLSIIEPSLHPWYDDVVPQQDDDDDDDEGSGNSTAPAGILPQCFSSESSCKKTTNDCSGHGSCESKYKYSEGSKTVQCYACLCNATVQGSGNTKLTTYWSGPACQKKDVSTPFWLLSGVTLALVLVITWGVGLLYTMGQQELPSVIGAGVAGPRPK